MIKGSETHAVPAAPVAKVVDTTGAGDLYAAGFLFGFTHGKPLAECARLGGIAAAEIISHVGARPEQRAEGADLSARPPHQPDGWRETLAIYTHPRVVTLLFLGFSAGLPFLLVFSTLSAWLREFGISRTAIGFISWIGITYSFKFVWSPVVDRVPLPWLTRWLGRRRSWMLLAQTGIGLGLLAMSFCDPRTDLWWLVVFALVVAFSSATQDIALDAFRIEATDE